VFAPVSRAGGGPGYGPDATHLESGIASDQDAGYGNIEGNGEGYRNEDADGGDYQGLPRRVRQANLAPQLRGPNPVGSGPAGVPQADPASLSDMRSTLSAMQRGWQEGRSQSTQWDTEGNPYGA
jgi:hypothetical protein